MNKKKIYLFGGVFVISMLFLFGLQYRYYKKVLSMNESQTRRLAKQTLVEVAEDLELNEFIRSLSFCLNKDLSLQKKVIKQELSDLLSKEMITYIDSLSNLKDVDTIQMKETLVWAYFKKRETLDKYILKQVYKGYHYDSIPQLVPPRRLCEEVRRNLKTKGIDNKFRLRLYNRKGELVYEHLEPGMLRISTDTLGGMRQDLFHESFFKEKKSSYITLTLDFEDSNCSILQFVLPGLLYFIFIILLGIVFVIFLLRELSFQSMKVNFVKSMTHELKTPVSSISLAIQSLRTKQEDGKQKERYALLNILEQEGNRLQLLVEKVLLSSLLRGKNYNMRFKTVDLYDVLYPIIDIYTMHARKLNGSLEVEDEASDTWISVDTIHLKNIFFNLLDNAVKYRRQDIPLELKVSIKNTDKNIVVIIEDNGIGVPKESLKKIFKRYYRVPTGNRHDVKGFGLGLAYVSDVVKLFHGTIVAQRSKSGGLRMSLTLPLSDIENEE